VKIDRGQSWQRRPGRRGVPLRPRLHRLLVRAIAAAGDLIDKVGHDCPRFGVPPPGRRRIMAQAKSAVRRKCLLSGENVCCQEKMSAVRRQRKPLSQQSDRRVGLWSSIGRRNVAYSSRNDTARKRAYPIALTIASINTFDGNGLVKNAMPPTAATFRLIVSSSNAVMNMVGYL